MSGWLEHIDPETRRRFERFFEQERLAGLLCRALHDEGIEACQGRLNEIIIEGPLVPDSLLIGTLGHAHLTLNQAIDLLAHFRGEEPDALRAFIALGGI